jgi:tetratricopeptide (TPR) repeat protein
MDTDEILARFLRERQILARLEHPNVARLLDGGVSHDDRPYFVMEHVSGVPITEYCDQRRLSIEERLRLFVAVCRAVQYAHRNLVVHRDLKPSNVLVTEAGDVKLLDFGVAKLLEEGAEGATIGGSGASAMTPEYASPEQVAGDPVTTASDVYQLGILLYELLTGHRPRGPARRGPREARAAILETEPRRPSTAVRQLETIVHRDGTTETIEPTAVSERRATSPERLQGRLRGDLDTIALTALRKEPDRRYPSAEALAEDVERHLADRPIRFGGDRGTYRAAKFVRRHRLPVAAAVTLIVATLAGASFYTLQIRAERDRALREAAKSAQSAELLHGFFESWNPDAADRGTVTSASVLRDAARRAQSELRNQPEMLAASLSILGGLLTSVGEHDAADSLLARALSIQEDLPGAESADLAATLARRGRLYWSLGENERAEASLRRALDLYRTWFGTRHMETLRVERDLALQLMRNAELEESELLFRGVLASLDEADRERSAFALETASQLGYNLFLQARYGEAIALLRPALDRQRVMFGETYGPTLQTMRYLGSSLRDSGELDEAERLYRDAERLTRRLYGDTHANTAGALTLLSIVLDRKGNLEEAERLARQDIAILGLDFPAIALELIRLGNIRLDRGDPVEAEHWLRRGLAGLRGRYPDGHPDETDALNRLSYILARRGAPDARRTYQEAIAFYRAHPETPVFAGDGLHFLAWTQHRMGDLAGSEASYRRALALYRRQLPPSHDYVAFTLEGLGRVLVDAGRATEAQAYLGEAEALTP